MICPSTAIQMLAWLVLMRFGVTSPSHTKPNPACHAAPGRAAPGLASPAAPDSQPPALGVLPCGTTGRSAAAFPGLSAQGKPGGHSSGTEKAQDRRERGRVPGPLSAGCLPTDGDTQVIRRTTTQPVRSIKGQRPRTATPISQTTCRTSTGRHASHISRPITLAQEHKRGYRATLLQRSGICVVSASMANS